LDQRLGKASGKRVPIDRAEEVEALYRERYQGFTAPKTYRGKRRTRAQKVGRVGISLRACCNSFRNQDICASSCERYSIDAHPAVRMPRYTRQFYVAAAYGWDAAEHVIEVRGVVGLAAQASPRLTARCTDDEVSYL
jgi:hypothetical protein